VPAPTSKDGGGPNFDKHPNQRWVLWPSRVTDVHVDQEPIQRVWSEEPEHPTNIPPMPVIDDLHELDVVLSPTDV
jgi:hypothetical protein